MDLVQVQDCTQRPKDDPNLFFTVTGDTAVELTLDIDQLVRSHSGSRKPDLLVIELARNPHGPAESQFSVQVMPSTDAQLDVRLTVDQPVAGFSVPLGQVLGDRLSVKVVAANSEEQQGIEAYVRMFLVNREELFHALEERIVWNLGVARSGTTWLAEIFWQLGRTVAIDESEIGQMFGFYNIFCPERFYPDEKFYRDYPTPEEVAANGEVVPPTDLRRPLQRQIIWAKPGIQSIFHERNKDLLRNSFRQMVFDLVIREWGISIYDFLMIKAPTDSMIADFLPYWMPRARLIACLRDGRDVMRSLFSPFMSPQLAQTENAALRYYAIAWHSHAYNLNMDVLRAAFGRHVQTRTHTLRYEQMRSHPEPEIKRLSEFLGLEIATQKIAEIADRTRLENQPAESRGPDKPRQNGKVGGYRDYFSISEILLMEKIMGRNLLRLGYTVDSVSKELCQTSATETHDQVAQAG